MSILDERVLDTFRAEGYLRNETPEMAEALKDTALFAARRASVAANDLAVKLEHHLVAMTDSRNAWRETACKLEGRLAAALGVTREEL